MAKGMTREEAGKARKSLPPDLRGHTRVVRDGCGGWLVVIGSRCDRSTLIEAARRKIPPYDGDYVSLREVCDSLDYEVIEAFLENGITAGIDSHAARERHRKDILDLYERHGFARDVKSVWKAGDRPLPGGYGGSARIPEGVIEIEGGEVRLDDADIQGDGRGGRARAPEHAAGNRFMRPR